MNENRFRVETLAMFFYFFRAIIRLGVLVFHVLALFINSLYNAAIRINERRK